MTKYIFVAEKSYQAEGCDLISKWLNQLGEGLIREIHDDSKGS